MVKKNTKTQEISKTAFYKLKEAISLVKKHATAKFDETVDVAVQLGVDPKQSDQNIRGMISLPHGTGKTYKVAVFAKGDKEAEAKKAGADLVGSDDLIEKIQQGKIEFDRCVATPDMMPVLGKVAKILGPKGLMPNPKLGTVTTDVEKTVKALKAGQVEFRVEKAGIVHAGVGKSSFNDHQLEENIRTFITALLKAKPSNSKGTYLRQIALSSSMGPGVKVDITDIGTK